MTESERAVTVLPALNTKFEPEPLQDAAQSTPQKLSAGKKPSADKIYPGDRVEDHSPISEGYIY